MGGDEWANLLPDEVQAYYQAWVRRQEREVKKTESVLRFFDLAIAQNSYLTIAPNLKKGSDTRIKDLRLMPDSSIDNTETDQSELKQWAHQKHLELCLRAKARASEYFKKMKGKKDGKGKNSGTTV